ncbi:unnamed protein product [Parascedosporium putredinis]|uniref:MIT domain-containing protein n=1 Tax=Parascedosporium putredinis TaxID=1442378 RepID=A0A9P1M9A7_9PEZI|nr:unnamed protein product [Parascedosporium putredinis]CAI7995326.1 unnamed protein product [Parascedosporium putredinis]
MLSKALQKANTAVQLDNAQNFEGARASYLEACELLQQVLQKTSSEDDRRKLEAIRTTYTSRIDELVQLSHEELISTDDKELPARPNSDSYPPSTTTTLDYDDEPEVTIIETATVTRIAPAAQNQSPPRNIIHPPRWASARTVEVEPTYSASPGSQWSPDNKVLLLQRPDADQDIPPPLSPRRPFEGLGIQPHTPTLIPTSQFSSAQVNNNRAPVTNGHYRDISQESNSWLDSKADSGGSTSSSVHSRTSSLNVRRKHIRAPSGATEAEFDAALDAAVEAAYDDGFTELESQRFEQERVMRRNNPQMDYASPTVPEDFYDDESSDEDERMLEEMTRGYEIEDFAFGRRDDQIADLPPRSDSRAWFGSVGLDGTAAKPSLRREMLGSMPRSLREPPRPSADPCAARSANALYPAPRHQRQRRNLPGRVAHHPRTSDGGGTTLLEGSPIIEEREDVEVEAVLARTASPLAHSLMTKNYSSSSLRSARSRNMSMSNLDDDLSPGTPSSNPFASTGRLPSISATSTPMISTFDEQFPTDSAESLYLFDGGLQSRSRPGSPDSQWGDAPVALEPCPSDFLLRPFWLMRCLYQTLAHSRGGYLSNKVFVPQEVWKVKGVKLRNLEDKISTCDYLTAALSKLAKVDTCDADAVLEEMQALEGVLEQMTVSLTRKLGNEVGVQTSSMLLRTL